MQYVLLFSLEKPGKRAAVTSALHVQIQEAFHQAGVQIMSPHYIADSADPKIPPARSA